KLRQEDLRERDSKLDTLILSRGPRFIRPHTPACLHSRLRRAVIVGAIGINSYVREFGVRSLKSIDRLVPITDLEKARALMERNAAEESAAKSTWLDYCRWVAGLQSSKPTIPLSAEYYVPTLP